MWIWLASCSLFDGSVIDTPPTETPVRPAPHRTGAIPLGRRSVAGRFELPPSSRPDGAPAPERFPLIGPLQFETTKKHADIYRAPLPVLDNLLPSEAGGTHHFGNTEPPGFVVSGPSGVLPFERGGRGTNTYGFDRQWLYIGVKKGSPAPKAESYFVGFEKATATENGFNLEASGLSPEAFVQRTVTVGVESWSGLYLPPPATATFDLEVPASAKLSFRARLLAPAIAAAESSDGADIEVSIRTSAQNESVIGTFHVSPDREQPVSIDLSAYTGPATLVIRTSAGASGDNTYDYLFLESPTIYPSKEDPERILLVFIDTLRPDHLGFMGYARPTSPTLDRLAAHAAVFTQARTVAPWTLPSARALLTGRQPESWFQSETLAEALGDAGWHTEALVSNAFLSQPFDLHRGWDHFAYDHLLPADQIVDRVIEKIAENEDRDLLLMVHFMEPHLPYEEPVGYWRRFTGRAPRSLRYMNRQLLIDLDPNHEDYEAIQKYITGRYDQNISFVDHELKTLFDAAGARATAVVFSDHGEELWDHGSFEHGHSFYDELLRVPLVIRSPHVTQGRYDSPVSLLDIAPTVREIAGVPPVAEPIPGRSLVGLTFGDEALRKELDARPLGFGRPLYGVDGWGVVTDKHKWWDRGGVQALFDLGADPAEQSDLAPASRDLERWPMALQDALDRKVEHVWRLDLTAVEWMYDLELTISHPDGFSRVWVGHDPRASRSNSVAVLENGRVSMRIEKGQRAPPSLYLVPSGDPYEPKGLAVTLVGRGVMLGATATRSRLTQRYDPQTIVATGNERFHFLVGLDWVPEPQGVEVAGFHPDMAAQLQQLGYFEGDSPPDKQDEDASP